MAALPVTLGVAMRMSAPRATSVIAPALAKAAVVLFVWVVVGAISTNWRSVFDNIAQLGFGLLSLGAALSVLGFAVSRLLGGPDREAKTITIETGVQNGALGVAIAGLLVADGPTFNAVAILAALYGVVWPGAALPNFLILARLRWARRQRVPCQC
ncbi:MAG: hypothetical protein AAGJ74_14870 [Pseudomonadota bacterium]